LLVLVLSPPPPHIHDLPSQLTYQERIVFLFALLDFLLSVWQEEACPESID
jgi:hypothetical protein